MTWIGGLVVFQKQIPSATNDLDWWLGGGPNKKSPLQLIGDLDWWLGGVPEGFPNFPPQEPGAQITKPTIETTC